MERFYLGAHQPSWLARTTVPLFVSHTTLSPRKSLPRATCVWAEDSGGFSEVSRHGGYRTPPRPYASNVRRHIDEIGNLQWAAIQDWMCEPFVLAKTGLTVHEHQQRSVHSYLDLMSIAPDVPWTPVLQGWEEDDYLRHIDMYTAAGVDLRALPVVGIGSVCRRQGTTGAVHLLLRITAEGLRLHGFGLKTTALKQLAPFFASADSMAWSFGARREKKRCGTPSATCANHLHEALRWREDVIACAGTEPVQLRLAA